MPRATNAPASHRRRKSRLKLAKGFYGSRSKLYRQATEAIDRAQAMAYTHRKQKKRNFRRLWAVRINAACRTNGMTYSRLMEGLRKSDVELNRKMLAEIAVYDEAGFSKLAETAKAALA